MTWIGERIVRDLRSEVFHHLQYLGMNFYDTCAPAPSCPGPRTTPSKSSDSSSSSAQNVVFEGVMLIGVGIILFRTTGALHSFTLDPVPVILIGIRHFTKRVRRIYRRVWIRRALMNSVLADSIPGIKVVKSFVQERREISKFDQRSDQVFERHIDVARYRSVFVPFLDFVTSTGNAHHLGLRRLPGRFRAPGLSRGRLRGVPLLPQPVLQPAQAHLRLQRRRPRGGNGGRTGL